MSNILEAPCTPSGTTDADADAVTPVKPRYEPVEGDLIAITSKRSARKVSGRVFAVADTSFWVEGTEFLEAQFDVFDSGFEFELLERPMPK